MSSALVLGLDGATFDVIDPLIAAGRLGRLARAHLEAHHGWSGLARRTLVVTEKLPGRGR